MRMKAAVIVVAAAVATLTNLGAETADAFSFLGHHRHKQHQQHYEYRCVRLHSATSSAAAAAAAAAAAEVTEQHPHTKIWTSTLNDDKNTSYVHPHIELAVRPPSEGGTGIIATNDIPMSNTVALSLSLDNVGMIDAASILDSYDDETDDNDGVLVMLKTMWNKEFSKSSTDDNNNNNSDEGKRLAVLAGIIAHLQLTRYKDGMVMDTEISSSSSSYAIEQSRRLGLFLDAMPLLPQHATATTNKEQSHHPFPTHFLYWTDDEIQILLQGTMCQTKAREVRAGIGLVIREWSSSFLAEHHGSTTISQTDILNAIFSAFTAVLSRSFGDAAGRDVDGKGRMLVPLVDMLNPTATLEEFQWARMIVCSRNFRLFINGHCTSALVPHADMLNLNINQLIIGFILYNVNQYSQKKSDVDQLLEPDLSTTASTTTTPTLPGSSAVALNYPTISRI